MKFTLDRHDPSVAPILGALVREQSKFRASDHTGSGDVPATLHSLLVDDTYWLVEQDPVTDRFLRVYRVLEGNLYDIEIPLLHPVKFITGKVEDLFKLSSSLKEKETGTIAVHWLGGDRCEVTLTLDGTTEEELRTMLAKLPDAARIQESFVALEPYSALELIHAS
jgi:hypothetical protein